MSKYMRSRHIPLATPEGRDVQEKIDDFFDGVEEGGSFLKTLREREKMSLNDLADRTGLNAEYLELMEQGERPITVTFAKVFGDLFDTDYHQFL